MPQLTPLNPGPERNPASLTLCFPILFPMASTDELCPRDWSSLRNASEKWHRSFLLEPHSLPSNNRSRRYLAAFSEFLNDLRLRALQPVGFITLYMTLLDLILTLCLLTSPSRLHVPLRNFKNLQQVAEPCASDSTGQGDRSTR